MRSLEVSFSSLASSWALRDILSFFFLIFDDGSGFLGLGRNVSLTQRYQDLLYRLFSDTFHREQLFFGGGFKIGRGLIAGFGQRLRRLRPDTRDRSQAAFFR